MYNHPTGLFGRNIYLFNHIEAIKRLQAKQNKALGGWLKQIAAKIIFLRLDGVMLDIVKSGKYFI